MVRERAPEAVGPAASPYFCYTYHPLNSPLQYLRWAATLPMRTRSGASAIARRANAAAPAIWGDDFDGKRALIVGSGPSLDRVDDSFFDRFDVVLFINFALKHANGRRPEYFFTTDSGPIRQFIDAHGVEPFRTLGQERCVFAPIFLDQWQGFTEEGRRLFTWLRYDAAKWRIVPFRRLGIGLPVTFRYHPRQPDWSSFNELPRGRTLPILDHTSALTAVLFAAMNGSCEIGLIGCDFSAGRAASVAGSQVDPGNVFEGAIGEFRQLSDALDRQGITVTNHSWEV